MHRARGGATVLSAPSPEQEPLPQAWVPRVLNLSIAAFLLIFISPVVTNVGGRPWYAQVTLGLLIALVLLFVWLCLASAVRPGSIGRFARRMRRSRR